MISSNILIALLITIVSSVPASDAAARTISVQLSRATTQGAGTFGQPVISYYSPVNIGTPPKRFNIQFDVGFSDLFVPHYSWNPFKTYLHYGSGFQCKQSTTCKKTDHEIVINYMKCKLTGKPYEDVMTFGAIRATSNQTTQSLASFRQNFLAISDASDARFKDLPVDGFFGLSVSPMSTSSLNNLLYSLHRGNLIDNLQFGINFNPILDSPYGGQVVLGGVDTTRYQGQIFWHKLSPVDTNWILNLQQVLVGNQMIGCAGQNCKATLSSTINEVYGPKNDVQKIYSILNTTSSSGLQLIDCRRLPQLPSITLYVDGIPYGLLPSNYVRKMESGHLFKNETCYIAILPSDETNQWILGTNFLSAYYSIFDITYRQIGFAALA